MTFLANLKAKDFCSLWGQRRMLHVIVNVWTCTRYVKYYEGIMIAPEGWSPSGAIIIPEGYLT